MIYQKVFLFIFCFSINFIFLRIHNIIPSDIATGLIDNHVKVNSKHEKKRSYLKETVIFKNISLIKSTGVNPSLSLKINNYLAPLLFQNRHGGLPLILYKELCSYFPIDVVHAIWHSFWRSIEIVFLFMFLTLLISSTNIALALSITTILDPLNFISYFVFISESINKTFIPIILYFLTSKSDRFRLSMLLVGLNLYVRINFLWMIILYVPYYFERYRKRVLEGLGFVLLALIPYLIIIDYQALYVEVRQVSDPGNLFTFFKNIIKLLLDKTSYLESFLEPGFEPRNSFSFTSLINGLILLFTIFATIYYKKNIKLLIGLLSSFVIIYFVTNSDNYLLYFFFINTPLIILLALALDSLKTKTANLIAISVVVFSIFQTFTFFTFYKNNYIANILNLDLQVNIVTKMMERPLKKYILVSESDLGKYEFLSNEKLDLTYIYPLAHEYKAKSLSELLTIYGKSGSLLVSNNDLWSTYSKKWGRFDLDVFFKEALKYDIQISSYEVIDGPNNNNYYIIDYEIDK